MKIFFLFLTLLISNVSADSSETIWNAYWDDEHYLRGFKDTNGVVKISPRFMGFTTATRFRNIISVMEERRGSFESYYLLKSGQEVKHGETYVSDMTFDCESENKIRFRSKKSDKVGFLDGAGKVIIPPIYSDASPFKNGLSSVIKNAKRMCHNGTEFSENNRCEHWRWDGGESFIINSKNDVLIKNAYLKHELDPYSLTISDASLKSNDVESLKGKNSKFYNFINFKLNFKNWLKNKLVINLDVTKLLNNSYKTFTLWDEKKGWYQTLSKDLSKRQVNRVIAELLALSSPNSKHFVTISGLIRSIYNDDEFDLLFDDCSNFRVNKYPVLQLITEHNINGDYKQNSFSFLKTNEGYKLISFSIITKEH